MDVHRDKEVRTARRVCVNSGHFHMAVRARAAAYLSCTQCAPSMPAKMLLASFIPHHIFSQ